MRGAWLWSGERGQGICLFAEDRGRGGGVGSCSGLLAWGEEVLLSLPSATHSLLLCHLQLHVSPFLPSAPHSSVTGFPMLLSYRNHYVATQPSFAIWISLSIFIPVDKLHEPPCLCVLSSACGEVGWENVRRRQLASALCPHDAPIRHPLWVQGEGEGQSQGEGEE